MYKDKKVSLNLCGGGARGVIQTGSIQAFIDSGIQADLVYGASVGALNACLYLQGEMNRARELWLNISNDKVYKFHFWTVPLLLVNRNYVFDSSPLKELINKYVDYSKLRNLPVKFQIIATNITDWTTEAYSPEDLTEEEFKTFLLASASPLLAFKPVLFRGKYYSDGGLINNYAVRNAIKDKADSIIIVTPTVREETKLGNGLDSFNLLTSLPEYCYLDRDLGTVELINKIQEPYPFLRNIDVTLIRPPKPTGVELLNFNYGGQEKAKEWMSYGYNLAKAVLDANFPEP